MPRFSRRDFLESSLATAAAALAAPSLARAADEPQPTSRAAGPNEKVRIACVGLHGRGENHMDAYLGMPDVELVALCDVDESVLNPRLDKAEKKSGRRPKGYSDLRKLFEDKEVDAVSLAMPIHWASLASIWAMQAGKDVYCEKPVCHNLFEGRRSVQAQRKYGRIVQAGTQSRSHKAVQDAIAYIHSGKLGKVTLARGLCYKRRTSIGIQPDGPVPAGVDYDIWLGPAPKRPFNPNRFHYNWHWNWDYGTGDLGNQGIHQMDIARWALDAHALPTRVTAAGGRFGYVDQGETPNTDVVLFDYGDSQLLFEVRGLPTPKLQGVDIGDIVYGPEGYVAFTADYGKAAAFDNDGKVVQEFKGAGDHFHNFIEAVRSRKQSDLHAPIEEGYLSSALCHLGNISYRVGKDAALSGEAHPFGEDKHGQEAFDRMRSHLSENGVDLGQTSYRVGSSLAFNPKNETFPGRADANKLLSRDYREPFVVPKRV